MNTILKTLPVIAGLLTIIAIGVKFCYEVYLQNPNIF